MSQNLLEYLIEDNSIDCPKEDLQMIQRLIAGKPYKNVKMLCACMFDLLSCISSCL
jgi:hypothetical protein